MPNHDDGLENLREQSETALIPELKRAVLHTWKEAARIRRAMKDTLGHFNVTKPARRHPDEMCDFTLSDKKGFSYQFTADSNGVNWGVSGYNILPCLNYIVENYHTEQNVTATIAKAVSDTKTHNHFYKRLIEAHPLIGTSILLSRIELSSLMATYPRKLKSEKYAGINPEQWHESHLRVAEKTLESISTAFSQLQDRCSDQITHSFLDDCRRECELLIIECCNFSFLLLDHFFKRALRNKFVLPLVTKDTPLTLSPQEYLERERDILRLRAGYVEYYKQSRLTNLFPVPDLSSIIKTGQIHLPAYASIHDIEALLQQYASLWEQMSHGLSKKIPFQFNGGYTHLGNGLEIGIQKGRSSSEDRVSFILPGFNIRIDKDMRHKMITLDIGGVSLEHALACAEEYLAAVKIEHTLPSVFEGVSGDLNPTIKLENKIALVASMMMSASYPVGLRKKPTVSHHSREFVAKDDYYSNFSHILDCIKEGLERPGK